jgi:hypothetical protein
MMSKWAEIEPAEEIAGVRTDAAGDKSRESEIAGAKALEWEDGGGVS